MKTDFRKALEHRRSYYALSDRSPVPDAEIEAIVDFAATYVPSAFNSQSTRLVLLLGEQHRKLWSLTKRVLQEIVPPEAFVNTRNKIDKSFASGYGTVLFFEDDAVIEQLQRSFPLYADNFPGWSLQTSAMHQLVVWTLLEDVGFGASLQHYNPLIDIPVRDTWSLPDTWKLIAQMPFGIPLETPKEKQSLPLNVRVKVFR